MIKRLLNFLDASPVNFLAVRNIVNELEQAGYRRMDPCEAIGQVKAGDKLYVTKNDSSVYAFHIGRKSLADAGFRMICAHCDSPTFRIKPNAKIWKCPSIDEWVKKMWYTYYTHIHMCKCYSAIKNKILPFVTTWMDLKCITLSEISQKSKNTI